MDVKVCPHATAGADGVARHYVRLPTPPLFLLARPTEEVREEKGEGGLADPALHLFLPDEITLHVPPPNAPSRSSTCYTSHPTPTRGPQVFGFLDARSLCLAGQTCLRWCARSSPK